MSRHQEPNGLVARLATGQLLDALAAQLDLGRLWLPITPRSERGREARYSSNKALWADLRSDELNAGSTIRLEGFWLSEWLPLRPGRAFHPRAARLAARASRQLLTRGRVEDLERELGYTIPPAVIDRLLHTGARVYDPWGKTDMFDSGIGCVRLKPVQIDGETSWFMGASSSSYAHEGIPVALPDELRDSYIERITEYGALQCTLIGQLRYLPRELDNISFDARVPQLYLFVEKVIKASTSAEFRLLASGAVLVETRHLNTDQTPQGASAAYVTFDPGERSSVDLAAEWLEETYVQGLLRGRVLTDFDEQTRHFDDAPFGVHTVMSGQISTRNAAEMLGRWHVDARATNIVIERIEAVNVVAHNDNSRVIRIGAGAHISSPVTIADQIENSFNALESTSMDPQVATLLTELVEVVNRVAGSEASPVIAEQMGRDVQVLTAELASNSPRQHWCRLALKGLSEAATTIGPGAAAILDIAAKLSGLL